MGYLENHGEYIKERGHSANIQMEKTIESKCVEGG